MTAAESNLTLTPASPTSWRFTPAPFWKRLGVNGSAIGIHMDDTVLRVAAARVRPGHADCPAAFTIRDYRNRPATEWRAEYLDALKKHGVGDTAATVLLPRHEVIARVVAYPGVADKDIPSALALDLDTMHPYGDEPIEWAWTRVTPDPSKPGSILVGIVRASTLQRYETLFAEAGIPVARMTFSASAIYSALRLYGTPAPGFLTWILDPGAETGEVYGESSSRAILSAEAATSMQDALGVGAAELRLPDNAEALPLASVLPQPRQSAVVEPIGDAISALAWAAALSGAAAWVTSPANLLPADRRDTASRGRLIPTFILACIVLAVVMALMFEKQFAERRYLKELNEQIAALQPKEQRTRAVDRKVAQTRARIELLDRFRNRTRDDVEIINELTRLLPPPIWISGLDIQADAVTIAGEADQAAPLLKVLDSSPLFRNSEFSMAVARNGANENFRIKTIRRRPQ